MAEAAAAPVGADPPAAARVHRVDPALLHQAADAGELYAVVDACAGGDVPAMAAAAGLGGAACLYRGMAARHYGDKAPYLFRADRALLDRLRGRFGDEPWGCLLLSAAGFDRVRRHLRGLLRAASPDGESWLFRFYDPRLLPTFLRHSTAAELDAFFGPVAAFALLNGSGEAFAAYRDPAAARPAPRRAVGARYPLSERQASGFRRTRFADRLAESFGTGAQRARRDPANDDVLVANPDGGTTRLHLDANGFVGGVTSPLGRRWSIDAGGDGKLRRLSTPSGSTLSIGYDPRGNVARVERDGRERLQARHDEHGRLEEARFPDGTTARTAFLLGAADPAGLFVSARADRLGRTERFGYAPDGALEEVVDGAGNALRFSYADGPRPDALHFPDGTREGYSYDPAGHLRRLVRADGSALDVRCDAAGRPVRIAAPDGVAEFEYDDSGRLVAARNAEVELAWAYDDAGRLVEERQGDAVVAYHHDAAGLAGMTYPSGETVRFARDLDARLVEIVDWAGGRHRIDYADDDRAWRLHAADGTTTTTWLHPTGHVAATRVEAGGAALFDCADALDDEDRVAERRDSRLGATRYEYDAEGQLLGVARDRGPSERFAYDVAGNRTACGAGAAAFDPLNRIVSQGGEAFAHDARGDMVERRGPGGGWRYRYDGFGRLALAEGTDGRRVSFGYDPLGRRLWKRVEAAGRERTTRFVWAGEQVVREVGHAAASWEAPGDAPFARDYLYWPHTPVPLLLRERGVVHQYHTDGNGVPQRVTAPDGVVVWEAAVDPFGAARVTVAGLAQPWRLPGQYHDEETGLHYNRHRYYDPSLGRYVSRDPLGVAGGLNLYTYVGNDPVNRADPLGLWWKTALTVVAAVAVAVAVVVAAPVVLPMIGIAAGTALAAGVTTVAASAAAGAVVFGLNEALNQETFCASCIALAALKGAGVGAAAALPFVFLPATAGVAAFMGAGALSGLVDYAGGSLANGTPFTAQGAALAAGIGAATAGLGRYLGGAPARPTGPVDRGLGGNRGHPYADDVIEGGSGRAVAGHGEYRPGSGTTIVPEGTSITLPRDGVNILDETGRYIERGDWDGLAAAAQRNPRIANDIDGMTTHLPGSEVPNYTLKAPNGLSVHRNSTTVEDPTPLSRILEPNMGCVDWAACTTYRR